MQVCSIASLALAFSEADGVIKLLSSHHCSLERDQLSSGLQLSRA